MSEGRIIVLGVRGDIEVGNEGEDSGAGSKGEDSGV